MTDKPTMARPSDPIALGHAWEWFRYHADQRMVMLRFYLTLIGFVFVAYSTALVNAFWEVGIGIGALSFLISLFFWRLDRRVSILIKLGEAALKVEQFRLSSDLDYKEIEICEMADKGRKQWLGSYSQVLKALHITFGLASILAIGFSWLKI